jgi:hypothetical protein
MIPNYDGCKPIVCANTLNLTIQPPKPYHVLFGTEAFSCL